MPGRSFYSGSYRYGFNGKENDNEVKGVEGSQQDYGMRIYDPRLGKFLSVDPLTKKYLELTPYQFASDRPVDGIDQDGLEWKDNKGNVLSEDQRKDVKVFIFYDSHLQGGFVKQTLKQYDEYESIYGKGSVAISYTSTEDKFAQDWHDMSGIDIKNVTLNLHGTAKSVFLYPEKQSYIVATETGYTEVLETQAFNIKDLPKPSGNISNATLFINSCHSNFQGSDGKRTYLKGSKLTVAESFNKYFDFYMIRGTKLGVSYYDGGFPHTSPGEDANMVEKLVNIANWDYFGRGKLAANVKKSIQRWDLGPKY